MKPSRGGALDPFWTSGRPLGNNRPQSLSDSLQRIGRRVANRTSGRIGLVCRDYCREQPNPHLSRIGNETPFAPSGASQLIPDGKPTFHSQSILCAPSTRNAHGSPWGNLGLLRGRLHCRSSTERCCCRRRFCEPVVRPSIRRLFAWPRTCFLPACCAFIGA